MARRYDELVDSIRRERNEESEDLSPGLSIEAPPILRQLEDKESDDKLDAYRKSVGSGDTVVVPDEGEPVSENRENADYNQDLQAAQRANSFADTLNFLTAGNLRFLHTVKGVQEIAKQMIQGTVGYAAGTIEGVRETIARNMEAAGDREELEAKATAELRAKLSTEEGEVPGTGLSPAYLEFLDTLANQRQEVNDLADGQIFLKRQQEIVGGPPFYYRPESPAGMAAEHVIGEGFHAFERWGDQAGDAVYESTGSETWATIVETGIAGSPYVIPLGFGRMYRGAQRAAERRSRNQRRKETERDTETFEPTFETPEGVSTGSMSPKEIIARSETFPTDEMILNRGFKSVDDVVKAYKGTRQKRPIVMELTENNKLRIVEGEVEVFARSKVRNSARKPMQVEIVQSRTGEVPFNRQAAEKVDTFFQRVEESRKVPIKDRMADILDRFIEQSFDQGHKAKKRFLNEAGVPGREAIMYHEVAAGATPWGKLKWQAWEDQIYAGLRQDKVQALDRILFNERVRQIDEMYGIGKKKHPEGITSIEATENLKKIRNELGDAEYRALQKRAEQYFDVPRQVLDELYVDGIITKELRDKLKPLRYEPRRLIEQLDRAEKFELPGQQPITVTDSGIAHLDRGTLKDLETNSRALMAEYVIRMENRRANNKAVKAVGRVADEVPDAGFVQKPRIAAWDKDGFASKMHIKDRLGNDKVVKMRVPDGMIRMNYWENGKQQPIFLEADMAKVWTNNTMTMSPRTANLLRILSFSFLVKPLATGYNPGFAAKNLFRDINHTYIASDQYSMLPGKYTAQIWADIARVAPDVWKKQGRFREAAEEGLFMDFLTHQGRDTLIPKTIGQQAAKHRTSTRHILETASKLNEFSEIVVRMALRDRAMRNGLSSKEATWEARRVLDFHQAGMTSRAVDHTVPYFNASMQAYRTSLRGIALEFEKGSMTRGSVKATRFAARKLSGKIANLMAGAAALQMAAFWTNPKAILDIPEEVRRKNYIIPLPEMFSFTDPRTGEYKHRYFTFARDNFATALLAPGEMLMEKYLYDINPDKELMEHIAFIGENSLPISPVDVNIPSLNAVMAYRANYDSWFGDERWHGGTVSPEQEFKEAPAIPTPQIWKDLSELAGTAGIPMSPERTEMAFRKLVPHNDYLDSMLYGLEKGLEPHMPLHERQRLTSQWFTRAPVLNRLLHETHPIANRQRMIEKGLQETGDRRIIVNREVDRQFAEFKAGEQTRREFEQWADNLEGREKERAYNRWQLNRRLTMALEQGKPGVEGIPARSEWLAMTNMDGIARAQYFYEVWRSREPAQRRQMERIGFALNETGRSFWNPEFGQEFERLKRQRGTDVY